MAKIDIKNAYLPTIYGILDELELSGRDSRQRVKFQQEIEKQHKEYNEDRDRLVQEVALKDKDGNPVEGEPTEDGSATFKLDPSKREYMETEEGLLNNEENEIKVIDLHVMKRILEDEVDFKLKGTRAFVHSYLLDQIEKEIEKEK